MSTNLTPLYQPGIERNLMLEFSEYPPYWKEFMHVDDTSMRINWDQTWSGYGMPPLRFPGQPFMQGQFNPSFSKVYIQQGRGLGDAFPYEDEEDDLYGVIRRVIPQRSGFMGVAFNTMVELDVANFFTNQGFASGTVAGMPDGVCIWSTAHPYSLTNANTWSNTPSVASDFSVASYQAAATNLRLQKRPDGVTVINGRPKKVMLNPALEYIAKQVLKSEWEPKTNDRNVNYIRDDKVEPVFWPYWNSSGSTGTNNSWFVIGQEWWFRFIWRQGFRTFVDFDVNVAAQICNCSIRYAYGITSALGSWGSPGV